MFKQLISKFKSLLGIQESVVIQLIPKYHLNLNNSNDIDFIVPMQEVLELRQKYNQLGDTKLDVDKDSIARLVAHAHHNGQATIISSNNYQRLTDTLCGDWKCVFYIDTVAEYPSKYPSDDYLDTVNTLKHYFSIEDDETDSEEDDELDEEEEIEEVEWYRTYDR